MVIERDTKKGHKMILGANVPVFTAEQKKDGMAKRIANVKAEAATNVQALKDIKVCLTIMASDPALYGDEMKADVEALLAEKTAQVKARYESNGWAFNF